MEWNAMVLLAFGAGLALGAGGVAFAQRRSVRAARERAERLAADLDETREAFEAHRQEVTKHFEQTSNLFRDLTEQYTRLYAHLAEGAREFCAGAVPALGRGFDGPLLGSSGDPLRAGEPSEGEVRAGPTGGGGRSSTDPR
jgi:hypothetical protein